MAIVPSSIYPVHLACKYVYLGVPFKHIVATVQTLSYTSWVPDIATPVNPLAEEIKLAQKQVKGLGVCVRKLPKVHNSQNLGSFSRIIILFTVVSVKETNKTASL